MGKWNKRAQEITGPGGSNPRGVCFRITGVLAEPRAAMEGGELAGMPNTHMATAPVVRRWRWVAAALAVTQLLAPTVANMLAGSFLESGATNEALITPAGYAFGLWGVITALSAVTAAAVMRYGLGAWWETSLLVDASVVFVGFSVWLLAAQDWLWVSVVVFMVMVAALIHIVRLLVLRRHELTCPSWLTVLAAVTFGLYLGWSSIAVFANVAAALINSGVPASVA